MSGTWAAGWAAADVVTSAEFKKGVGAVYDTTLGVAAASIDVTGIVGSYAHLMIEIDGRGDTVATSVGVSLRLNNDSAANYDWQYVQGAGATASAGETIGATSLGLGSISAASAPATVTGSIRIRIANYAGAISQKALVADTAYKTGTASGNIVRQSIAGFWRNANAITRVTVIPNAGNFAAGTRLTIYAMGA